MLTVQQPHVQQPYTVLCKTRGCQCSFRLLMMGGVSPETCWASYKYGIINFDTLLHLVWFFAVCVVLWCTDPRTSSSLYTFTVMPETSYKMKHLQYGTCFDVMNSCFLEFPNIFCILCVCVWVGGVLLLLLSLLLVDAKAAGEAFS